jgi:hypothetical protein
VQWKMQADTTNFRYPKALVCSRNGLCVHGPKGDINCVDVPRKETGEPVIDTERVSECRLSGDRRHIALFSKKDNVVCFLACSDHFGVTRHYKDDVVSFGFIGKRSFVSTAASSGVRLHVEQITGQSGVETYELVGSGAVVPIGSHTGGFLHCGNVLCVSWSAEREQDVLTVCHRQALPDGCRVLCYATMGKYTSWVACLSADKEDICVYRVSFHAATGATSTCTLSVSARDVDCVEAVSVSRLGDLFVPYTSGAVVFEPSCKVSNFLCSSYKVHAVQTDFCPVQSLCFGTCVFAVHPRGELFLWTGKDLVKTPQNNVSSIDYA